MTIHVYFIQNIQTQDYKIGKTIDPISRLSQLQTAHSVKNILLLYKSIHVKDIIVERLLHKYFEDFRLNGEWFNITKIQIDDILNLLNPDNTNANSNILITQMRKAISNPFVVMTYNMFVKADTNYTIVKNVTLQKAQQTQQVTSNTSKSQNSPSNNTNDKHIKIYDNKFVCNFCDISCDDASNFKKHTQTTKHTDCVKYSTFYKEIFKKIHYFALKDKNTQDAKNIKFSIDNLNQTNILINPICVAQMSVTKDEEYVDIKIDTKNFVCPLCNKNFITTGTANSDGMKNDIYLKRYIDHFNMCENKLKYAQLSESDIIEFNTLVEYCNGLLNNLNKLTTLYNTQLSELSEFNKNYNTVADKNIKLKTKCKKLKNKLKIIKKITKQQNQHT